MLIKTLLLITFFTAIYIIFLSLGFFDITLKIEIYNSLIEFKLITVILVFLILQILIILLYKLCLYLSVLPQKISDKKKLKQIQLNKKILQNILCKLIMNEGSSIEQEENSLLKEYFDEISYNLFISYKASENVNNLDKRITILKEIKEHIKNIYIEKMLIKLLYQKKYYKESEQLINEQTAIQNDSDIIMILSAIYSQNLQREKLEFIISKIISNIQDFSQEQREQIAKNILSVGTGEYSKDNEAIKSLYEKAFTIDPTNIELIKLLLKIYSNMSEPSLIKGLLERSFKAKPSLELVILYCKSFNISDDSENEKIFEVLKFFLNIIDPITKPELFLTISAYLRLEKETEEFKNLIK